MEERSCAAGAARSSSSLFARDMFLLQSRPHCLLPWQQTEISLHTLHPSAFQHRYRLPSPPCQPPRSYYPPLCFEHPQELGEYMSIDFPADKRSETSHMTNSDVSEITASVPYEQYHFVNELLFSWPCQSGDPAVWAFSYQESPSEEACRETLSGLQRRDERGGKGHTKSPVWCPPPQQQQQENIFFPCSPNRNRLTSTLPWRQLKMIGSEDRLRRRGRFCHQDTKPAEYRWGLGLFWTLWPLTSFHSHTLKCQRWMKICQRLYSGCVSSALSIWGLTFWQRLTLCVFLTFLKPSR